MLDGKLNIKLQIEMLTTQLSKSCGILVKSKRYVNNSLPKSVTLLFYLLI